MARLEVTPDSVTFHAQWEVLQLDVVAYGSDGRRIDPGFLVWTSTNRGAARSSHEATITAGADGSAVVRGTAESGATDSVLVRVAQLATDVAIESDSVVLTALGPGEHLAREARDANGYLIQHGRFDWSTTDSAIVTVSGFGELTGISDGSARVFLTVDGVRDSVDVRVQQTVDDVLVTPGFAFTTSPGDQVQLSAEARDANANVMTAPVAWRSTDPTIATVDDAGLVTLLAEGSAGVVAAVAGVEHASGVTVGNAADWGGVDEWTQVGGNARHTGHVPVALDVGAFDQTWTASVQFVEHFHDAMSASDLVVFATDDSGIQQVGAFRSVDGSLAWVRDLSAFGTVEQPVIDGGVVYVVTRGRDDATLWALDGASGDSIFARTYPGMGDAPFVPFTAGGNVHLGGGGPPDLLAMSGIDGTELWRTPVPGTQLSLPVVVDDRVFVYSGDPAAGFAGFRTADGVADTWSPDGGFTGGIGVDEQVLSATDAGTLVTVQGTRLLAFDPTTGSLRWEQSVPADDVTAAVADGRVFVRDRNRIRVFAEADGALLWSWGEGFTSLDGPIIVTKNLVIVGSQAIHRASHTLVWSAPVGGRPTLSPEGRLYLSHPGGITQIRVR